MGDLRRMLGPKTVAFLGASEKENSAGQIIMKNLTSSGSHKTFPVNPHARSIQGLPCFRTVTDIPEHVDLAIVAAPAPNVPQLVSECGKKGVDGIIIISRGFREAGEEGTALEEQVALLGRQSGIRIMGPNSLGIIRPNVGLNACLLPLQPEAGKIAFFSKSGALGSAMLDWAGSRRIGFSMFASLGSMIDVDFGDLIDFVGDDDETRSILLYMKRVGDARKFMSAARGFARSKPIIVMKPGRITELEKVILSGGASLMGDDRVYGAAFERAGTVRVDEISELFGAAEVLDSKVLPRGPNLAIISNSPEASNIAAAALIKQGGILARLSANSINLLDSEPLVLSDRRNPIDIRDNVDMGRYETSVRICMDDSTVDAVLLIYAYPAKSNPLDVAGVVAAATKQRLKPLITVWIGGKYLNAAREILIQNEIPTYRSPEQAIKAYLYMYQYRRNLNLQYETPEELRVDLAPSKNHLKTLVQKAIDRDGAALSREESEDFLTTYSIPVIPALAAGDVSTAVSRAQSIGFPVVLKRDSPDAPYENGVGRVIRDIRNADELRSAYLQILDNTKNNFPNAPISAVRVQKMVIPVDYELLLSVRSDRDFGRVIIFGSGGRAGQMMNDWSIGIPPLNQTLARRLMEKTKVYKMFEGFGEREPTSLIALEQLVVSLSNLVVDFPEIGSIDVAPLVISKGQPYVLGARVILSEVRPLQGRPYPHLVISPYPIRYVSAWRMKDGTEVALRPVRPEDEPMLTDMLSRLTEQSMRARFFSVFRYFSHDMLSRLCNVDYDRHMAIIAEIREDSQPCIIGTARLIAEANMEGAEFAVVVRDDYQRKGLGYKLIDMIIGIGQDWGLKEIYGEVLTENEKMLALTRRLGFARQWLGGGVTKVVLKLR